MPAPDPVDVLTGLWRAAGFDDASLRDVTFTGSEPVLPSSFAVGTAAQATIGAAALAAAELWRLRTGRRQGVRVDMRMPRSNSAANVTCTSTVTLLRILMTG